MNHEIAPEYDTRTIWQIREENVAMMAPHPIVIDPPPPLSEEELRDAEIHSAQQALGYARPEPPKARMRIHRDAEPGEIPVPPEAYTPEHIHAIRLRLGLKQRQFADVLNVSDKAVKAWEQGLNPPSGPALRLLQIAELYPEVFHERLGA